MLWGDGCTSAMASRAGKAGGILCGDGSTMAVARSRQGSVGQGQRGSSRGEHIVYTQAIAEAIRELDGRAARWQQWQRPRGWKTDAQAGLRDAVTVIGAETCGADDVTVSRGRKEGDRGRRAQGEKQGVCKRGTWTSRQDAGRKQTCMQRGWAFRRQSELVMTAEVAERGLSRRLAPKAGRAERPRSWRLQFCFSADASEVAAGFSYDPGRRAGGGLGADDACMEQVPGRRRRGNVQPAVVQSSNTGWERPASSRDGPTCSTAARNGTACSRASRASRDTSQPTWAAAAEEVCVEAAAAAAVAGWAGAETLFCRWGAAGRLGRAQAAEAAEPVRAAGGVCRRTWAGGSAGCGHASSEALPGHQGYESRRCRQGRAGRVGAYMTPPPPPPERPPPPSPPGKEPPVLGEMVRHCCCGSASGGDL